MKMYEQYINSIFKKKWRREKQFSAISLTQIIRLWLCNGYTEEAQPRQVSCKVDHCNEELRHSLSECISQVLLFKGCEESTRVRFSRSAIVSGSDDECLRISPVLILDRSCPSNDFLAMFCFCRISSSTHQRYWTEMMKTEEKSES